MSVRLGTFDEDPGVRRAGASSWPSRPLGADSGRRPAALRGSRRGAAWRTPVARCPTARSHGRHRDPERRGGHVPAARRPARRGAGHPRPHRAARRVGRAARTARPSGTRAPASFLGQDCPPEVNPSLWRQARLNTEHGLFEVPTASTRCAATTSPTSRSSAARPAGSSSTRSPPRRPRGRRSSWWPSTSASGPSSAVIYTHSHVDHFGGVAASSSDDDVANGRADHRARRASSTPPCSENVLAGPAMARRAELHVRRPAAARPARPRRRRPRQGDVRAARRV